MTCGTPVLDDDVIVIDEYTNATYDFGHRLLLQCKNSDYKRKHGDIEIFCTESGGWNGTALECSRRPSSNTDSATPIYVGVGITVGALILIALLLLDFWRHMLRKRKGRRHQRRRRSFENGRTVLSRPVAFFSRLSADMYMRTVLGGRFEEKHQATNAGIDNKAFTFDNGHLLHNGHLLQVSRIANHSDGVTVTGANAYDTFPVRAKRKKKRIFPAVSCLQVPNTGENDQRTGDDNTNTHSDKRADKMIRYYTDDTLGISSGCDVIARHDDLEVAQSAQAQEIRHTDKHDSTTESRSFSDNVRTIQPLNVNDLLQTTSAETVPVIIHENKATISHEYPRRPVTETRPTPDETHRHITIDIANVQSAIVKPPNAGSYIEFNHSSLAPRTKAAQIEQTRPYSAGYKRISDLSTIGTRPNFKLTPVKGRDPWRATSLTCVTSSRTNSSAQEATTLNGTSV